MSEAASIAANSDPALRYRRILLKLSGEAFGGGKLGADPDVRNGFSDITVSYDIDADASPADLQAIVAQSQKRSAVYDVLTNPTNIAVKVN